MPNSRIISSRPMARRVSVAHRFNRYLTGIAGCVAVAGWVSESHAQVAAEGYAVERLNPASAGSPWLVMDDLKLEGPLGGGVSLVTSYARQPLRVSNPDGSQTLSVISNQAFVDVGLAILYDRFRFVLDVPDPLYITGRSGNVGNVQYTAPTLDPSKYPDKVSDFRFGVDARLWGVVNGPLRFGFSGQLFVPSGERDTYVTDGTFRGLLRALWAGNWGIVDHAGFVGVHLRPRDDSGTLGSTALGGPRGSELVFGLGLAPQFAVSTSTRAGLGPELFGETAFKDAFGKYTTALETLLSANLTHVDEHGALVRFKVGGGPGINAQFGAPTWRMILGLEISDRVRKQ